MIKIPFADAKHEGINPGDLFWVPLRDKAESEIVHPHVIIQVNANTRGQIETVVVCGLSTNMKRVFEWGNILLEPGEANLTRQSIVIVSQVSTVKKSQLGQYIGTLDQNRLSQIFAGLALLRSFTDRAQDRIQNIDT
jgi:mRNA interferase MazF